jgi:hypothetical protein
LTEQIDGIVLSCKGGCEVFAAKIVDELERSLMVTLYLTRGDDPAEGVIDLAEISGKVTVKLLSRDANVLVVEINAQIDVIFIIIKVRAKGVVLGVNNNRKAP